MTITFVYFRYVRRSRYETRTRRKRRTIYECCTGYRQEGDQCPLGLADYLRKIEQGFHSFYVECISQETKTHIWFLFKGKLKVFSKNTLISMKCLFQEPLDSMNLTVITN